MVLVFILSYQNINIYEARKKNVQTNAQIKNKEAFNII